MKASITIWMLCISTVALSQPQHAIERPFWETWWFRLLIFLLMIVIIYVAYRIRVKQIQREEKMRSDYEIKLNELESNSFRSQLNPHFIFNSLNTINSFINKNEGATANQYITKFSKLIRLILDYSRLRTITLTDELNVVDLYVQLECIRFENKFNYHINIAEGIDTSITEIAPLIIQPFVENAILHGLLPLKDKGLLQINLQSKNNLLLCTIEDNGIGRYRAMYNKHLSPKDPKSYGIEVTLKRIELFNRERNINIPVLITDLTDANGNPSGTKVEIALALQEAF